MTVPNAAADAGMRHKFDVECGYAALNVASRNAMTRPLPAGPFALVSEGIERLPVLDSRRCATYRALMDAADPVLDDRAFRLAMLGEVLSDAVDRRLTAYFGSEYLPLWCRFYRADPDKPPSVSFRWHCDGGPSRHLKILVYLNGCDEHGGDTICCDRATTDAFKQAGYVFGDVRRRLEDVEPLAEAAGIRFAPISFWPETGDALIFEPMAIMHRGCWPRRATRYIIQICLLPSPLPWREMCGHFDLPGRRNDWPVVGLNWPAPAL